MVSAVIRPFAVVGLHRQQLSNLLHSLRGGNLTTLAVGHRDAVVAVGKISDGVCTVDE